MSRPKSWVGTSPPFAPSQPPAQSFRGTRGVSRVVVALDVALVEREYAMAGRSFYVLGDASSEASVSFDETGNSIPISRGFGLVGPAFERFYLTAPAQAGRKLQILVSQEPMGLGGPERGVSTLVDDPFALVVLAPAIVVPAGPAEWTLLKSDDANAATILIGGPTISVVRGLPLFPGDSLVIPGQPETWATTSVINQVLWILRMQEPS